MRILNWSAAAAGICAALSIGTIIPAKAEYCTEDVITDSLGQSVYYGQEYYAPFAGLSDYCLYLPGVSYLDAGYIYSQYDNFYLYLPEAGRYILLQPDFTNPYAWAYADTGYNIPELWGQCTWFTWGRFMEIYGFDPLFTGDGWQVAWELEAAYPDSFELSYTPAAGAVFSTNAQYNHCGMVLWTDGWNMIIQDANLDGVSNYDWNEATQDYWTRMVTIEQMQALYGDDVIYANPIPGMV